MLGPTLSSPFAPDCHRQRVKVAVGVVGVQINHLKVFTNAQTQAGWHVATLPKCFSMWMWCQHLFHTHLHVEGRGGETCSA